MHADEDLGFLVNAEQKEVMSPLAMDNFFANF